jgi:hypothetical protein
MGAHSWTSANDETDAAWADFTINPDGGANVYIGGSGWDNSTAIVTVQNSTGYVGIGTTTPVTKLNIEGDFTANSAFKAGSIEIQPYALNNAWIGENVYLDGSDFIRRVTGSAGLFYFQGSEGQFRFASSDSAGTSIPPNVKLKISHEGKFGVGNAVDNNYDGFAGSVLYADGASKVGINTITPNEALTVIGNLSATGTLSLSTIQIRTRPTANLFIGNSTTGRDATTGNHNFVFGLCAGNALTTGSNNVFIGNCAGRLNTTGGNNNFFGNSTGLSNTTGGCNNFLGNYAGLSNTTGGYNNFLGLNAGSLNTTGSSNNILGRRAGRFNTTGSYNNFLGNQAGCNNTIGSNNNFLGNQAGYFNTTGGYNNFLGRDAGRANTTGRYNNFLGHCAGFTNTIGSNNTIVGNRANVATNSLSGVIVLGTGAIATETNQIVLSTASALFRSTGNTFEIGSSVVTNNLAVYGTLQATVKNFHIEHPTKPGKHLVYSSLEAPYNGIQLTGEDEVVNGIGVVELPDYLNDLIHSDSIHIQLTNYQHAETLYVESVNIDQNNFTVKCDSWFNKTETLKFFWLLNGVRKDVERLETEV